MGPLIVRFCVPLNVWPFTTTLKLSHVPPLAASAGVAGASASAIEVIAARASRQGFITGPPEDVGHRAGAFISCDTPRCQTSRQEGLGGRSRRSYRPLGHV